MSEDNRTRLKQMLASGEIRLDVLSPPQREIWEASRVPADSVANHICAYIQVRGGITPKDCEAALRKVVERQDVLRLSFLPGKVQPVQMIRAKGEPVFRHRQVPASQRDPESVEELMREIFQRPFDMVAGPLYRVEMLQLAPDESLIVFAIHHSIADGWSLGVFLQDLTTAYIQSVRGIPGALPPVPMTYSAWAAAERAYWQPALLEERAAYWKPLLEGTTRLWAPPSPSTDPLRRWITHIPAALASTIRDQARRTSTTLFSTLLAGFQLTLAEWTGKKDIVVGSPVANRNKQAAQETMGYFSGVVPIRSHVDPKQPSAERIKAVHHDAVEAFVNAMPFADLAKALDEVPSPTHNPIFDVRFALQNHPVPDVALPGLSVKLRMRSTGTARFDLACEVTEEGSALEVVWLYRPNLFSQDELEKLNGMYQAILAQTCQAPESRPAVLQS